MFVGTLEVEPIPNESGRYYIGEKKWLVDVYENFGLGWCACPNFEFDRTKYLPELTGLPENPDRYRCKHIKAGRIAEGLMMVDRVIAFMAERSMEHGV